MTARHFHPTLCSTVLGLGVLATAQAVFASNPLEYPDNGSAAFSRGGAWLAVANEPIAAHYNPAALATQASAFSIEQQLNFVHTCFDRKGPSDSVVGPDATAQLADGTPVFSYRNVCNARSSFPNAIPSIAVAWRASPKVGVGFAIVPPATYGTADQSFPLLAQGYDNQTKTPALLPAPYRYMEVSQLSTILFPTISVGYEIAERLRLGVGFVSGIGIIDTTVAGVSNLRGAVDAQGDHMIDDALTRIRTQDLFVPGFVASVHWSVSDLLDLALWGRVMSSIETSSGVVDVTTQPFNGNGNANPPCAGTPVSGGATDYTACSANQSVPNHFTNALTHFEYPIPPEVRLGVRFHRPRGHSRTLFGGDGVVRDPLHDDLFDVELDESVAFNAAASAIEVRFREQNGAGAVLTNPTNVPLPPNADRPTGYRDSVGLRVGGQWNAVRDRFAVRAGGWLETQSQDPRFLTVAPVGATRWGFGGGVVVRYGFMDVSFGYQRQMSAGLDNGGNGALLAPAGTGTGSAVPFNLDREPPNVSAADRTQFRTTHAVNGGSVTFDAHVFTLGGVVRF